DLLSLLGDECRRAILITDHLRRVVDRFEDVGSLEALRHVGQVGTDALAFLAVLVTLQALRLLKGDAALRDVALAALLLEEGEQLVVLVLRVGGLIAGDVGRGRLLRKTLDKPLRPRTQLFLPVALTGAELAVVAPVAQQLDGPPAVPRVEARGGDEHGAV